MSSPDDTKEIPTRQVADTQQPEPWRVHVDGIGALCVLASDGQLIAETFPITSDRFGDVGQLARARVLAKAPEMHHFLSRLIDNVEGHGALSEDAIFGLFEDIRRLIKRTE